MDNTNDVKKKSRIWIIICDLLCVLAVGLILFALGRAIYDNAFEPPVVYDFNILEMDPGAYAYRETHVSTVPAQNYTMITVMDSSGSIYTIQGSVSTVDTDDRPHCVWTHYKHVTGKDKVTVYAPPGTVKYLGAVGGR